MRMQVDFPEKIHLHMSITHHIIIVQCTNVWVESH